MKNILATAYFFLLSALLLTIPKHARADPATENADHAEAETEAPQDTESADNWGGPFWGGYGGCGYGYGGCGYPFYGGGWGYGGWGRGYGWGRRGGYGRWGRGRYGRWGRGHW